MMTDAVYKQFRSQAIVQNDPKRKEEKEKRQHTTAASNKITPP
jgi:hypothetical protein